MKCEFTDAAAAAKEAAGKAAIAGITGSSIDMT